MQVALRPPRRPAFDRRNANLFLAVIFWAFTYALFTYRANLRYGDAYELISAVRLVPTLIGAALYWLVLSRLIDDTSRRAGKPLAMLATIIPASIIVLLARVVLDRLGAANPNGFAGDLRFVMVWGGYFGLWVSASFALRVVPRLNVRSMPGIGAVFQGSPAKKRGGSTALARAEKLERLALEIATLPSSERQALLDCFEARDRYETADELDRQLYR